MGTDPLEVGSADGGVSGTATSPASAASTGEAVSATVSAPAPSQSATAADPVPDAGNDGAPQCPVVEAGTGVEPGVVQPLTNHFEEALGLSPAAVNRRVSDVYEQLFHSNVDGEPIYYEVGSNEAYIFDVLHNDTRMEALGNGLMITVELDHQVEFDRLWRYTKRRFLLTEGPMAGYFAARCEVDTDNCSAEAATSGAFFTITALLFAHARWGSQGTFDYFEEALQRLDTMRTKEDQNGGVVDGVINLFDPVTHLPRNLPNEGSADRFQVGAQMPAFFEVWGQSTGEAFWLEAAQASRALLRRVPHPVTGLVPGVVTLDGTPIAGEDIFRDKSYGLGFSLALDSEWYGIDTMQPQLSDNLLQFFVDYGIDSYPGAFEYDTGNAATSLPEGQVGSPALVALNGAAAAIATIPEREEFIRAVWDLQVPTGRFRYFDGVQQLLALLFLSGEIAPLVRTPPDAGCP